MTPLLIALIACSDPTCPEGYAFDLDGLCTECADGYREDASAGTCVAEEPSDTGTADTGSTDTDADDTGADDTPDSGDTPDTGACGTDDLSVTVEVVYSVWTESTGCWATETAALPARWWYAWLAECGVVFEDVSMQLVDGDRCLLFPATPAEGEPWADPGFVATPEQQDACGAVFAAADTYPDCETAR